MCGSRCGVADMNSIGKMIILVRVYSVVIFGGRFDRGDLLLGRWGIIDAKAKPNRAYLDFDLARPVPRCYPVFSTLRTIGLRAHWICYTRTRKGWHLDIDLSCKLVPGETIALQAILGSDARRETLNLMRVIAMRRFRTSKFWRERWNILYSGKLS